MQTDKWCGARTDTMSGNNCTVNLNTQSVGQIAANNKHRIIWNTAELRQYSITCEYRRYQLFLMSYVYIIAAESYWLINRLKCHYNFKTF